MSEIKIKVHISESQDPYKNMVLEDHLLRTNYSSDNSSMEENEIRLLFWRNIDCVVIGRFQNPWIECDLDYLSKENIILVRRQSGGGTVFHDLGNLNFSIICPKKSFDKNSNLEKIKDSLNRKFALDIQISPRDDLLLDHKKISGSAFRFLKDRVLHHGTLLINSDLHKIRRSLNSPLRSNILESKAVSSVSSKITNMLNQANQAFQLHQDNCENIYMKAIIGAFVGEDRLDESLDKVYWSEDKMKDDIVNFNVMVDKFKSKEWLIDETPFFKYEYRHPTNKENKNSSNLISSQLAVNKGKIVEMCCYDCEGNLYKKKFDFVTYSTVS